MKIELASVAPALDTYVEMRVVMQRMAQAIAAGMYLNSQGRLTSTQKIKIGVMSQALHSLNKAATENNGMAPITSDVYEPWSTAVFGEPELYVDSYVGTQVETNLNW